MIIKVTVTDVLRNFADYINRVAYRGERFVLVRGGRPVAELGPLPSGTRLADLPELLASLPRLDSEEAEAFEADIRRSRADLDRRPVDDPWES